MLQTRPSQRCQNFVNTPPSENKIPPHSFNFFAPSAFSQQTTSQLRNLLANARTFLQPT
jgi:hypothetical protein